MSCPRCMEVSGLCEECEKCLYPSQQPSAEPLSHISHISHQVVDDNKVIAQPTAGEAELLPHDRIVELLREFGIDQTDTLKHVLEDHRRWNRDVPNLEIAKFELRQQLAAKDAELEQWKEVSGLSTPEELDKIMDGVLAKNLEPLEPLLDIDEHDAKVRRDHTRFKHTSTCKRAKETEG